MSIKLKKVQRKSPLNKELSRWYLVQASSGSIGLKEIAKEIQGRSSLSLGDVQSVLSNLIDVMPVFLKLGLTVKLEGLGNIRVSVSSEGADNPEALSAHNVKGLKLVFLPSVDLKNSLRRVPLELNQ